MKRILIAVIRLYQKIISPHLGYACRFYPTCSEYMIESLRKKGILKGFLKGAARILRCHPFSKGGFDPVR